MPENESQPLEYATPTRRTPRPWPWVAFVTTVLGLTGAHFCIAFIVAMGDTFPPPAVVWLLFPLECFPERFVSSVARIASMGPFILNELIFAVCLAAVFAACRHVPMFFGLKTAR